MNKRLLCLVSMFCFFTCGLFASMPQPTPPLAPSETPVPSPSPTTYNVFSMSNTPTPPAVAEPTMSFAAMVLEDYSGLPANFAWLEKGKIAGMARPETEVQIENLAKRNIGLIVSLIDANHLQQEFEWCEKYGIIFLHLPVADIIPSVAQIKQFAAAVLDAYSRKKAVAVHCEQGMVRTPNALGCWLVAARGLTAEEAFTRIKNAFSLNRIPNIAALKAVEEAFSPVPLVRAVRPIASRGRGSEVRSSRGRGLRPAAASSAPSTPEPGTPVSGTPKPKKEGDVD